MNQTVIITLLSCVVGGILIAYLISSWMPSPKTKDEIDEQQLADYIELATEMNTCESLRDLDKCYKPLMKFSCKYTSGYGQVQSKELRGSYNRNRDRLTPVYEYSYSR